MKHPKALLSAILSVALLASVASPAYAATLTTADSGAQVTVNTSSADAATFSWDNATVYFLLTDRFKNGNTSNDGAYGRKKTVGGDNRATFHGGDFAGITEEIEAGYFDDLGVNAIWLSAPYEQIHGYIVGGDGTPSFAHYSYHGYYVLDYTETDAAFGTKEEFKTMVDTAHKHGIRIVLDIVMNHAGYNSLQDMDEYGFGSMSAGWDTYYNDGSNVNNKDYHSYIDYTASADLWLKWWGADWIRCGLPGYTPGGNDEQTRTLDGLPDFKTESTTSVGLPPILVTKWTKEGTLSAKQSKYGTSNTVTGYISTWLAEWVREYGVDGFRCDTAKHVAVNDWKKLKDACTTALAEWKAANPDKKLDDLPFWMTGEHWDHDIGYGADAYFTSGAFDSMINFQTQGGGMLDGSKLAGVYQYYADSINTVDNFNQLSYISSHDSTLARGDQYHLGSALLMLPGGIQIYYGDETCRDFVPGIPVTGDGHAVRSDMNWESIDKDVLAHWQKVGTFRNNHVAVGAGANVALTSSSGTAFGRTYDKNGVTDKIVGVIDADANTSVTVDVTGVFEDGATLRNWYDEESYDVSGGKVTVNSGAHGTILLEMGEADSVKAKLAGEASFDTNQEVTVTLEGVDSAVLTIDGIKKVNVKNGDKVTIGDASYPGDTVEVTLTFTHPTKGEVVKKFSYKKNGSTDGAGGGRSDSAIVHVFTDLTGVNLYAWQGDGETATKLAGEWPGTALSAKDDDGWYVMDLKTTEKFNAIVDQETNKQTADLTGLQGETWIICDSSYKTQIFTDKNAALKASGKDIPESDFDKLKQECKEIKLLDTAGYAADSYAAAMAVVTEADKLIAQGKSEADAAAVTDMYKKVKAAKEALLSGQKIDTASDTSSDTETTGTDTTGTDTTGTDTTGTDTTGTDTTDTTGTDTTGTDTTGTDTTGTDTTGTDTTGTDTTGTDTSSDVVVTPGKGDVNKDGKVSLKDASVVQRADVGIGTPLSDEQVKAADMNNDGKADLKDAYLIQTQVTADYSK